MMIDWEMKKVKIKRMIREMGYSIKTIANELCVSESTIKNYVYAETKIPIDTLCQLKILFGVEKIEDLLVIKD